MNKINELLAQVKQIAMRLWHQLSAVFNRLRQSIMTLPRVSKYANESNASKGQFYLGTVYLTIKGIVKRFFLVLIFGAFLALGIGIGFAVGLLQDQPVPSIAQLDKQINHPEQASTLYYADMQKISDIKSDIKATHISKNKLTPLVKQAVIATEDETFYDHSGVLPKSLIRAIFSELTGIGVSTGGSTLTQQLVKMQFLTNQTTWKRKVIEMFFAKKIEAHFSKDEILNAYLNVVPFGKNSSGQNIAGIEEATTGIFGKKIADLTLPQAAFIAGLPQSPSAYTPFTITGKLKKDYSLGLKRKNIVLFRMYRNGNITKQEYTAAKNYDLAQDFAQPQKNSQVNGYNNYLYNLVANKSVELIANSLIRQNKERVADVVKDEAEYNQYLAQASELLKQKGYHVKTTIDKNMYAIMSQTVANAELGTVHTTTNYDTSLNRNVNITEKAQNGSVMIDNETGRVIAFAGGVDFENSQVNHAFNTYRSPGSSIKPYLVYAPAIENKLIGTKTVLPDFPTNYGSYIPTDYGQSVENRFISADEALRMSYNLPAVSLFNEVRKQTPVQEYMQKLGFNIDNSEFKQLGLALGGTKYGFSVAENAAAFASFYNDGARSEPYYIDQITDPSGKVIYQHHTKKTKVFSKGTAYIMQKMLHEVTTQGTAAQLSYGLNFDTSNLIGKTGTSNDYRDIWFNGATPGVTISSWMGYDNFYGHTYTLSDNASSINMSLWTEMVNQLYATNPKIFKLDKASEKPATVHSHEVLRQTGTKAGSVNYDGATVNLTGSMTTSLSLSTHARAASAEFSVGANKKDYDLFFDYKLGKLSNYGTRLYYTGETINTKENVADLFVENKNSALNKNYYGTNITPPSTPSANTEVEGNDEEPQTTGGTPPTNSNENQPAGNTTTNQTGAGSNAESPNQTTEQPSQQTNPPETTGGNN